MVSLTINDDNCFFLFFFSLSMLAILDWIVLSITLSSLLINFYRSLYKHDYELVWTTLLLTATFLFTLHFFFLFSFFGKKREGKGEPWETNMLCSILQCLLTHRFVYDAFLVISFHSVYWSWYYFVKWKKPICIICVLTSLLVASWNFRMATAVFHQAIGTLQSYQYLHNSRFHRDFGNVPVKLVSKGLKVDIGLSRRGSFSSANRNFSVIQASASQTSVVDPVSSPLNNSTDELRKKSGRSLILVQVSYPFIEQEGSISVRNPNSQKVSSMWIWRHKS